MAGFGLSSYERVPYMGRPFSDTHPDKLATIALLFGMNPPDVPRARVLEIGCATGANLIPMAAELPEASFLGLDASERQVAEGCATIEAAGLTNVELRQVNVLDVGPDLGTFDYIICHGVFSWVAAEVQDKILTLIAATLAPNGVGYLSYNTYPGWHMQGILREAMFFHLDGEAEPQEGIRKARELLDFLVQFESEPDSYYLSMVRSKRAWLLEREDSHLYHDFLEGVNQPLYYHEMLERLTKVDLQAVADADFPRNGCVAPEPVKAALRQMSSDPGRREGYLDLLRGRSFRRTLLCHAEVELLSEPSLALVEKLQAAAPVTPGTLRPGFVAGAVETSRNSRDQQTTITHPVLKAAVLILGERWPQAMPFADVWLQVVDRLSHTGIPPSALGEPERRRLAAFLLQGYGSGWIELHTHTAPFIVEPGGRPATTPLARHQARSGQQVANLRHETGDLSRFDRHLLGFLDGHRTLAELAEALDTLVTEGTLVIKRTDPGPLDDASRRAIVAEALRQGLARLARSAFLVG